MTIAVYDYTRGLGPAEESPDANQPIPVGGTVRALLAVQVDLAGYMDAHPGERFPWEGWARGLSLRDVDGLWNRAFESRGYSTRLETLAWRLSDAGSGHPVMESRGTTVTLRIEVVGKVTHNVALAAWVLLAVLVGALADVTLNGGRVLKATGAVVGSTLAEIVAPVLDAAVVPLALAVIGGGLLLFWWWSQ